MPDGSLKLPRRSTTRQERHWAGNDQETSREGSSKAAIDRHSLALLRRPLESALVEMVPSTGRRQTLECLTGRAVRDECIPEPLVGSSLRTPEVEPQEVEPIDQVITIVVVRGTQYLCRGNHIASLDADDPRLAKGQWRSRCVETRTPGPGDGLGKRIGSNPGTLPWSTLRQPGPPRIPAIVLTVQVDGGVSSSLLTR